MRRGELRNATGVNRLPFDYIREVQEAQFRACRQSAREPPGPPEPVISGELLRRTSPGSPAETPGASRYAGEAAQLPFWLDEHEQQSLRMYSNG
jgi:hypothetical protein